MQDRQETILKLLAQHHTLSFRQLAELLYVSEPTVRRDVARLEALGLIEHIYGGAKLAQYKNEVVPIVLRDSANAAQKDRIARMAAERIRDGDTIFLDSSSTVRRVCRYLDGKRDLTIFTNNLRVLPELRGSGVRVFVTGGAYYEERECFLGPMAERFLEGIHADLLFFSCLGVSAEGVLSDVSEEEIAIRQVMMRRASRKIFLCDSSKYGVVKPMQLCTMQDVDEILSDRPLEFRTE